MTEHEDRGDGSYNKKTHSNEMLMSLQTQPIDGRPDLTTVDTGSNPAVIIRFYSPEIDEGALAVNVNSTGFDHHQLISALELVLDGLKHGVEADTVESDKN